MKIKPATKDFAAWSRCVPRKGDLLFFQEEQLPRIPAKFRGVPTQSAKKNPKLWPPNHRSWYGYSLSQASRCRWMKAGEIEKLPLDLFEIFAQTQVSAKVPTLILASRLPKKVRSQAPSWKKYAWITSATWQKLGRAEKISVMRAWFIQNELIHQPSIPLSKLSEPVSRRLKELGLKDILHTFRASSGGNCFATAAAFATKSTKLREEWMLWRPLQKHLARAGFKLMRNGAEPTYRDVLVFESKGNAVHAVIYLGDGICFEKPGQDFYDPYRLVKLANWRKEWPKAKLKVFRKRGAV